MSFSMAPYRSLRVLATGILAGLVLAGAVLAGDRHEAARGFPRPRVWCQDGDCWSDLPIREAIPMGRPAGYDEAGRVVFDQAGLSPEEIAYIRACDLRRRSGGGRTRFGKKDLTTGKVQIRWKLYGLEYERAKAWVAAGAPPGEWIRDDEALAWVARQSARTGGDPLDGQAQSPGAERLGFSTPEQFRQKLRMSEPDPVTGELRIGAPARPERPARKPAVSTIP